MSTALAFSDSVVFAGITPLLWVLLAGVLSAAINVVIGGGGLVSFPILLMVGLPAVAANMTNNVGLVFGGLTGAWGYRRELLQLRTSMSALVTVSVLGGAVGAALLIILPAESFTVAVPVLVAAAAVVLLASPAINRWVRRRSTPDVGIADTEPEAKSLDVHASGSDAAAQAPGHARLWAVAGIGLVGVYGGYFGAAQSVMLLAVLSVAVAWSMQHLIAMKVLLSTVVNVTAAVVFIVWRPLDIDWPAVVVLAVAALLGGVIGVRVARVLPPAVVRWSVAVLATVTVLQWSFQR